MAEDKEAFIGIDVAKLRNAVAVADAGRDGEVRFYGEVDVVAAWSVDRLGRSLQDLVGILNKLRSREVDLLTRPPRRARD